MKVRNVQRHGDEEIELQMTPMIDIVFQLLVFFIMTFKVVSPEGDFNIKMPRAAPSEGLPDDDEPMIAIVELRAKANGGLAGVKWGGEKMGTGNFQGRPFEHLTSKAMEFVHDDRGPEATALMAEAVEVELDCDPHLRYQHVIKAITHISGYIDKGQEEPVRLINKIKFKPPSPS